MITATVLTKNNEKTLRATLDSLSKFPEVILLDSGSEDQTLEIAKEYPNVKTFTTSFLGFGPMHNYATKLASHDWILSIDSDEVVTEPLVEEILKTFEPFKYKAVILTKLDETLRIGNILSVLAASRKPISYIADGQSVPQDIEQASVLRLLMNLDGFHINRERLEKRFGARAKITDAYWS